MRTSPRTQRLQLLETGKPIFFGQPEVGHHLRRILAKKLISKKAEFLEGAKVAKDGQATVAGFLKRELWAERDRRGRKSR